MRIRRVDFAPPTATPARWLGACGVVVLTLAGIGLIAVPLGFDSPFFALQLHFLLMTGAVGVDKLLSPELAGPRFDVSASEVRLYRRLGVIAFMKLLRRIGWEAAMRDRKVFDGSRSTLASYERATRHGENAHAWLFLIALVPIAWAAAEGLWDAVFWIGSMNVVFHAYPVMLQRTQRARLRSMLARLPEAPARGPRAESLR